MGEKGWNDAFEIVSDNEEMWKLNKQFLDEQKVLNKRFFFSHNPDDATGFMLQEVIYLKQDLKAIDIKEINDDLWEVIW
jgi:hypothetical protein